MAKRSWRFIKADKGEGVVRVGYARVSTQDQDCAIQVAALEAAGCRPIRSENKTGTKLAGRSELEIALSIVGVGDRLVVTRLDRLGRSLADLLEVVKRVEAQGASLQVLEQPVDTSTAAGRAFLQMLGVFAEFETGIRRERQLEGVAKAKAEGKYEGGKRRVDPAAVRKLRAEGLGATEIAKKLGCDPRTVYRLTPGMWLEPTATRISASPS